MGAEWPASVHCQKGEGSGEGRELTAHELWEVHNEATAFSIMISEDTVVGKLPAEGVGKVDDYAFGSYALIWLGDIDL